MCPVSICSGALGVGIRPGSLWWCACLRVKLRHWLYGDGFNSGTWAHLAECEIGCNRVPTADIEKLRYFNVGHSGGFH